MNRSFLALLFCCALLLVASPAFAQSARAEAVEAQALLNKLDSTRLDAVDWEDKPLEDALRYIGNKAGVNILVDTNQLDAQDYDVTLDVRNLTALNVLKLTLRMVRLKAEFADGVLWVIPKDGEGKASTVVVVHDVRDITTPLRDFVGPTMQLAHDDQGGVRIHIPDPDPEREVTDIDDLMDLIQDQITPDKWGGEYTISDFNGTLIISAPADVHAQIRDLLNQLR